MKVKVCSLCKERYVVHPLSETLVVKCQYGHPLDPKPFQQLEPTGDHAPSSPTESEFPSAAAAQPSGHSPAPAEAEPGMESPPGPTSPHRQRVQPHPRISEELGARRQRTSESGQSRRPMPARGTPRRIPEPPLQPVELKMRNWNFQRALRHSTMMMMTMMSQSLWRIRSSRRFPVGTRHSRVRVYSPLPALGPSSVSGRTPFYDLSSKAASLRIVSAGYPRRLLSELVSLSG